MKKLIIVLIFSWSCVVHANHILPAPVMRCDKDGICHKQICDGDGFCNDITEKCPANRPIKLSVGLCVSCNNSQWQYIVKSPADCAVCKNRGVVQYNGQFWCILKQAPMDKPLKVKYGYLACGHCAADEDILDCSKCLDDFDIINGKCHRKEFRACFTE